jgi:hypothetical protein
VATRIEFQKLLSLIERSGLSDDQLEGLFGVHQTTVWRLRHGRIAKIGKYVEALEAHFADAGEQSDRRMLEDLLALSHHSAEVRTILESLHSLMRETA